MSIAVSCLIAPSVPLDAHADRGSPGSCRALQPNPDAVYRQDPTPHDRSGDRWQARVLRRLAAKKLGGT